MSDSHLQDDPVVADSHWQNIQPSIYSNQAR
jgi:hypothetical protein